MLIERFVLVFTEASVKGGVSVLDVFARRAPPRVLKTHLPYRVLRNALSNTNTKLICLMRNPKDTLVSLFHFYRMNAVLGKFKGTWDEFYKLFQQQRLMYEDWFKHTDDYWTQRSNPNVLIVKFEEMVENLREVVLKMARFLGKDLNSEAVERIVNWGQFDNLRKTMSINTKLYKAMDMKVTQFFRKGEVGDWKNYFSEAQSDEIDRMFSEQLSGRGLYFKYHADPESENVSSKL